MPTAVLCIALVPLLLLTALDGTHPLAGAAAHRAAVPTRPDHEWPVYGGDEGGTRFSPLDELHAGNVGQLAVAWTYRTGDILQGASGTRFQATPLMVDGRLLVSTPFGRVIALKPDTGEVLWEFDPRIDLEGDYGDFANRGVAYWRSGRAGERGPCTAQVFVAPIDARLIALDATTGRRCRRFGTRGEVSLQRDLVNAPAYAGEYQVTSPPVVVGDVVVVGSAVADNQRVDAPSGVVRAYDVRSGRLRWRWDPMPDRAGAANVWSIMSADPTRDLVFVPTGSASPDFFGGERPGDNRHANSVVALRASTGELVWAFQAVHHDVWDYDLASQPVLATIRRDGRDVPVVMQATKMGHVFVLNRETGQPVVPIEERAVPRTDVPGERVAPTQPFPPAAFALSPHGLDAATAWGADADDLTACRALLDGARSDGIFTPPSLQGSVVYPGNVGGSHWGGVSWDPIRRRLLAPTNRLPFLIRLVPRDSLAQARDAARPGVETARQAGTPYGMQREVLRAPSGLPCSPPPWGVLTSLDIEEGVRVWERPLGAMATSHPDAAQWGSVNLGGVLVTGGGLAFVAATQDAHLRAFDVDTGTERWRSRLPAGGHALPMTYRYNGRQYVVIVAGGHPRMGSPAADHVVAFALGGSGPAAPPPLDAWVGTFEGEFRGGRRRYRLQLRVRLVDDEPVAAVTLQEPRATGVLAGRHDGDAIRWVGTLDVRTAGCEVTLDVPSSLANGNRDLIGDGTVVGTCTEGRVEPAAFQLRRR